MDKQLNKYRGIKRQLKVALKEILGMNENMDGYHNLMQLHVVTGKDLRSKMGVHRVMATSCTIGLNWTKLPIESSINKGENIHPLFITSQVPDKLLLSLKTDSEHTAGALAFYTWLMNDSPYAKAFVVKNMQQVLELGHFVVTANIDHRIVIEALMCTRYCWEQWCANFCILFKKLTDAGVTGNMAFQMTYHLKTDDDGGVYSYTSMSGHCAPQSNMKYSAALQQFVCVGKLLSQDVENLVGVRGRKLRWEDFKKDTLSNRGYLDLPNKLTFKNLGGFVSGTVSKGWGEDEGWNVMSYVNNFIEQLATVGVAKGLFHKAYKKRFGRNPTVEDTSENWAKMARFFNQMEIYLKEGIDPTVGLQEAQAA